MRFSNCASHVVLLRLEEALQYKPLVVSEVYNALLTSKRVVIQSVENFPDPLFL